MNLEQVRNPHLIFPGQVLFLDKSNGRARLRMGAPVGGAGDAEAVAARPLASDIAARRHRLDPVQPDRALPQRGGDLRDQRARRRAAHRRHAGRPRAARRAATPPTSAATSAPEREYRIFREPRPLRDPTTKEVLGYEATYVGAAEYTRPGRDAHRRRRQGRDRPGDLHGHQHPPGSRRRRPARAGAGARVHQLRAAPAGGADRRPDRLDLRRRPDRRPEPDRRAQQRRASTASSAATCSRSSATARSSSTRPKRAARRSSCPTSATACCSCSASSSRMSYALILSVKDPVAPGDRFTQP